jgi:hypothetical protein
MPSEIVFTPGADDSAPALGTLCVQRRRHRIKVVIEQIGVRVEGYLRRLVSQHPRQRQHVEASRDGQRRADAALGRLVRQVLHTASRVDLARIAARVVQAGAVTVPMTISTLKSPG